MRRSNVAFYVTSGFVAVGLLGAFITLSIVIGEDFAIPALITGGIVASIVLRGPVGKALAQRISDTAVGPPEVPIEMLEDMDDMRHRMVELEERVDFTERLLAQARADEPAQLPPA